MPVLRGEAAGDTWVRMSLKLEAERACRRLEASSRGLEALDRTCSEVVVSKSMKTDAETSEHRAVCRSRESALGGTPV